MKRAAAAVASVSLATSGLSSCDDNGGVDPVPPPLQCSAMDMGQLLEVTSAQRLGLEVRMVLTSLTPGIWTSIGLQDTDNITGVSTELPTGFGPVFITVVLTSDAVTEASFTFVGVLQDTSFPDVSCTVTRTFFVSLQDGEVIVAQRARLPLEARQMPRLAIVKQAGRVVDVEASTAYEGEATAEWGVTGGSLETVSSARVRWRLPADPGLYQVEVVMDYGPDGIGFDALTLEVAPA